MQKLDNVLVYLFLGVIIAMMILTKCEDFPHNPEYLTRTDTVISHDTVYKTDTFKLVKTVPRTVVEILRDTIVTKDDDSIILVTESKKYIDTVSTNDRDSIILQSYISGINARLDSQKVSLRKSEVTNTTVITNTVEKKRRFSIGIQAGYGFGLKNRDIEPYIGFGIAYNL